MPRSISTLGREGRSGAPWGHQAPRGPEEEPPGTLGGSAESRGTDSGQPGRWGSGKQLSPPQWDIHGAAKSQLLDRAQPALGNPTRTSRAQGPIWGTKASADGKEGRLRASHEGFEVLILGTQEMKLNYWTPAGGSVLLYPPLLLLVLGQPHPFSGRLGAAFLTPISPAPSALLLGQRDWF